MRVGSVSLRSASTGSAMPTGTLATSSQTRFDCAGGCQRGANHAPIHRRAGDGLEGRPRLGPSLGAPQLPPSKPPSPTATGRAHRGAAELLVVEVVSFRCIKHPDDVRQVGGETGLRVCIHGDTPRVLCNHPITLGSAQPVWLTRDISCSHSVAGLQCPRNLVLRSQMPMPMPRNSCCDGSSGIACHEERIEALEAQLARNAFEPAPQ